MNEYLIIGRKDPLLESDVSNYSTKLKTEVNNNSFLVIGGAGSIGSAVVKELFVRNPKNSML